MTYVFLNQEQQSNMLKSKQLSLEGEHCKLTIDLLIAKKRMKENMPEAEGSVMDLEKKLREVEVSLSAFSDGE